MMKEFSLDDKVAIVTGASGLLGEYHCIALAESGAQVIALDLDEMALKRLKDQPGVILKVADVTNKEELIQLKGEILDDHGRIDVLVNNAAIDDKFENPLEQFEQSKFENFPLASWEKSIKVNLTGVFLCSQVFGGAMAEQGAGSIINIASTYGVVGPDQRLYQKDGEQLFFKTPTYPATKGAILNFTRYLAAYWGEKGVRVNALSPGGVQNGQESWFVENYSNKTPLNRMAQPDDYKGAIVFLASEASSYMTGANLVVDGGWTAI